MKLSEWTDEQYGNYGRTPQVAQHSLAQHEMFSREALIKTLDQFPRHELQAFTMGHDPCNPGDWSCVDTANATGEELWQAVERGKLWLNLLWAEKEDERYAELLDSMYGQLSERIPRLRGYSDPHLTLLISSPNAIVYYHFDAEDNMLWHIHGNKTIFVYPESYRTSAPADVVEDIFARTKSEELPFESEFDTGAQRFELSGGEVVSWPHNSPHRIENGNTVNVSLSTSVETELSERRRLTHCANRVMRRQLGYQARSVEDAGAVAAVKRFGFRAANRLGLVPSEPHPEYVTKFQIDAEHPQGMRELDTPVRTAFCSVSKAQMAAAASS